MLLLLRPKRLLGVKVGCSFFREPREKEKGKFPVSNIVNA